MKIPYTVIGPADPSVIRAFPSNKVVSLPLIKFALGYKGKKYQFKALLDSGADVSLYPMDVAELLEINLKKAEEYRVVGINGQVITTKLHEVTMMYDKYSFKITVGFSTAAVGARAFGAAGIIGHRGFFDRFIVSFNYKKQYFEVKKPFSIGF